MSELWRTARITSPKPNTRYSYALAFVCPLQRQHHRLCPPPWRLYC